MSGQYVIKSQDYGQLNRVHALLNLLIVLAILLFPLFAETSGAATVTLTWDPNSEPTVAGYRLYVGTSSRHYTSSVDVANSTRATISSLIEGVTYYMAVTAYDVSGNQSGYSDEIVYTAPGGSSPSPSPGSGTVSGGGGGGCFIATAAFGSAMAPEVALLREFRDTYLLTNGPGRAFVDCYYRVSPPIAEFIRRDEDLRRIARAVLWPLVYGVKNPASASAIVVTALLLGVLRCTVRRRRPEMQTASPATGHNLLFRHRD
ncbi:MAG: fibronectin type III domain-containing protein [Syntrophaceae bacterium]|nr:fibronectin type III domain-containing protein [Syntrophaceae bacterium]